MSTPQNGIEPATSNLNVPPDAERNARRAHHGCTAGITTVEPPAMRVLS
ncbi:MAG TPA: hypothetical protein VE545_06735 [Candidatus Dormibacteraeota bacterium]|nr:hypothetical protein [Candidatus Dormibacteraeota bacterium]